MAARSKLKNFAPKILLCAGLIVLSIRNANIVMQTNRQTGIYRCRRGCVKSTAARPERAEAHSPGQRPGK